MYETLLPALSNVGFASLLFAALLTVLSTRASSEGKFDIRQLLAIVVAWSLAVVSLVCLVLYGLIRFGLI